ncbi:malate:quinone oxidoreductase [Escherichia coli]
MSRGEFERLNNAGTGHSALMELNYTPAKRRWQYQY